MDGKLKGLGGRIKWRDARQKKNATKKQKEGEQKVTLFITVSQEKTPQMELHFSFCARTSLPPISLSLLLLPPLPPHRLYLPASPSLSADTALSGVLMRCQLFEVEAEKTSFIHLIFGSSL